MAKFQIEEDVISGLNDLIGDDDDADETTDSISSWTPSLNPTQLKIFDCNKKNVFAYGERASGKSVGFLHKIIRHAYEGFNALVMIVVKVRSMATNGGVWTNLIYDVLPQWERGLGLRTSEEKMDEMRCRYIFVENRHGGWSKIFLMSLPHEEQVAPRVKGIEPSMIYVDEITSMEGPAYYDAMVQQVGRKKGAKVPQQYCASCNPEGPSHWVYELFFERGFNAKGDRPDFESFHVPISENQQNIPEDYYDRVMDAVANDPIDYARLVEGKWVDRPSGDAIFNDFFQEALHMRGDDSKRILPNPDYPVVIGYDLGQTCNAIVFMQNIPLKDKMVWLVFDEMVYVNRKISYELLVPNIVRRLDFWNTRMETKFTWDHCSDNSAFNQFRAAQGTYDHLDVERISRRVSESFEEPSYEIRFRPAPKFPGSVEARVRMLQAKLMQEAILISTHCPRVRDMFMFLESEKPKLDKYDPRLPFKPRRSKHVHVFDALTYAIACYEMTHAGEMIAHAETKDELITLGN